MLSAIHTISNAAEMALRYRRIRRETEALCHPLRVEDMGVQPYEWVSPPKWHLAHTTWFFETFLLLPYLEGYRVFDAAYAFLYNSYYESVGPRVEKANRGFYSRPTVEEVYRYRHLVDLAMEDLIASGRVEAPEVAFLLETGLNHEQQHQELLLADIKAILHMNPTRPAYRVDYPAAPGPGEQSPPGAGMDWTADTAWWSIPGGLREIGWSGEGFAYDNERPRHKVWLEDFRLASGPVTQGQWLRFMQEGGYGRPELWLSEGWRLARLGAWQAPLYWEREGGEPDGRWMTFGWGGLEPADPAAPVRHISHYEADAFARWSGARLPTEAEWEAAMEGRFKPGKAWEWTGSSYLPYPRFKPFAGPLGEYNAKFMASQMILRGGSEATPGGHMRVTYRNFFPPEARWQFTGLRLAEDP